MISLGCVSDIFDRLLDMRLASWAESDNQVVEFFVIGRYVNYLPYFSSQAVECFHEVGWQGCSKSDKVTVDSIEEAKEFEHRTELAISEDFLHFVTDNVIELIFFDKPH